MMDKNREIKIMGIVNLTDNSYFAESRCLDTDGESDVDKILGRVSGMLENGAGIIDIGACSTRPGSEPVGKEMEWKRLEPALFEICKRFPGMEISIDTYWSDIVKRAFDLIGPFIVNDISSGEDDPAMLETVGKLGLPYIAMHKRGNPKTMQTLTEYNDVTEDLLEYFRKFSEKAEKAGITDWIPDPGFGFAKTIDQNYQLLRDLGRFKEFGRKILIGLSRKSMIFKLFGITPEESLPATQVLHYQALCNGADILRVHDVAEAARTVALYRKLS
ncbi:MAG: dihydropteroate synthase [Bacteroidales bacterium]|nr:dihydropteroate synthase [Bacteroidales bacterium]MCI1785163.1 dihydropteroate synthase [Bacteroidales bacterium]